MEGELQDWEVLPSSGSTVEDNKSNSLEEIKDVTQGMIAFDYFSLENNNGVLRVETVDEHSEDGSVQSGSPGWIEPRSDAPYGRKHSSELWSDSSSDVGIVENVKREFIIDEYKESIAREKHLERVWLDSDEKMGLMNSEEEAERKDKSSFSNEVISGNDPLVGEGTIDPFVKSDGGREEKWFVWWKIPIELLKYCVFRVNPIWSISMAATVVGFVMLGRRLYNMKKKSRTLQLKVLLDDKKVANYTARWNDAIAVAKRVPIIRPALPSSMDMNQWSIMSLR